mmetsp:Transcript_45276/g.73453  ORF Transcript_45276/g.73453 Transcript_45276/m.73453 type:complete len:230 (-) Transcript_45276:69-758(-)
MTLPGPVSVVSVKPSPPQHIIPIPPTQRKPNWQVVCQATTHCLSTTMVSSARRVFSSMDPAALRKIQPLPLILFKMKPCPASAPFEIVPPDCRPARSMLNWICGSIAARKAWRLTNTSPCHSSKFTGTTFAGKLAPSPTTLSLVLSVFVQWTRNKESPARNTRLMTPKQPPVPASTMLLTDMSQWIMQPGSAQQDWPGFKVIWSICWSSPMISTPGVPCNMCLVSTTWN